MSILIDEKTRLVVQGATGNQASFDIQFCIDYGTQVVAGVTPGRGGENVDGVPIFNTVKAAVRSTGANASAIYVPARAVRGAVFEAVDADINMMLALAENVPNHDASAAVTAARQANSYLIGFNTNGVISPGKCKIGGIGGDRADQIYQPGRIGVCSRSGGMSAEISMALERGGFGVSTCVSMGGDPIVGTRMVEILRLFEDDPKTDACVIFGEPGGTHELEVAQALKNKEIRKPLVALVAGIFQENYPVGISFGHMGAIIKQQNDSASFKQQTLKKSGAFVVHSLEQIPERLAEV